MRNLPQDKNNPFRLAEGCRVFKMDTYKEHERAHHPKVEEVRNIKTAVAQAELLETDRMVRVFLLVYWLASEALPMLRIYTLARLISLLQFRNERCKLCAERGQQLRESHGRQGHDDVFSPSIDSAT